MPCLIAPKAESLEMNTTAPPPSARIGPSTAWVHAMAVNRFTSMVRCHSAVGLVGEEPGLAPAGVVDQHVDPAPDAGGLAGHGGGRVRLGQVGYGRPRVRGARPPGLGRDRLGLGTIDVGDEHPGALGGEAKG